ncbi:MAG: hypothetical protein P4M13_00810 [Alphaproteobacteria bacterium]|nr:hypothetical protein [Alphaproteobacteria bacterium]
MEVDLALGLGFVFDRLRKRDIAARVDIDDRNMPKRAGIIVDIGGGDFPKTASSRFYRVPER